MPRPKKTIEEPTTAVVEENEEAAEASAEEAGSADEQAQEELIPRSQFEDALRAQDDLRRQFEEREAEYQERTRNLESVLGRQGDELGRLRQAITERQQPPAPAPRKRVKLDPIADENFTETFDNYLGETLAERDRRLVEQLNSQHQRELENLRFEMGVKQDAENLKQQFGFNDRDIKDAAQYGTDYGIPNLQAAAFMVPKLRDKMMRSNRNGHDKRYDNRNDRQNQHDNRDDRRDDRRDEKRKPEFDAREVAKEFTKPKPAPPPRGGMRPNDGDIVSKVMSMSQAEYDVLTDAERAELDRKVRAAAMAGMKQTF